MRSTCHNVVCLFRYKNIPPLASTVWQLQIPFQIQWQVFVTSSRWELKCKISLNIFLYWIKFFRLLKTKHFFCCKRKRAREREGGETRMNSKKYKHSQLPPLHIFHKVWTEQLPTFRGYQIFISFRIHILIYCNGRNFPRSLGRNPL